MNDVLLNEALILKRVKSLPSMSTVISEMSALVNDARANAADFEEVIRKDAGLAAALLKLANSAAFGLQGRVSSIEHAASLLGINRMLDLAVCASFSKVIPKSLPGYGISAKDFWRHNAATAVLSEKFAEHVGLPLSTETFACGLLHDCGKLVISQFLKNGDPGLAEALAKGESPAVEAERALLGMDHAEVGQIVVRTWNLPKTIGDAARWHHAPQQAPKESDRGSVGVVHVASVMAHQYGFGEEADGETENPDAETCARLKLDTETANRITMASISQINTIANML